MTELIILLIRPERPSVITDIEPTPAEIQRWEDDGGAVLSVPQQRVRCHCGANHRQRAAA